MRTFVALMAVGVLALVSCGADETGFDVELELPLDRPGDVISLRPDGPNVEFISRRAGEIYRLDRESPAAGPELLATIDVGTDGEQRGLLGHAVIDGRRFAAWTDVETLDLVVGEVSSNGVDRIVWSGTSTQSKAIGGHLEEYRDQLLLGLGELTGWGQTHGSGALVLLDPDGPPEQEPIVLSDGWNNPFAFTVTTSGEVWVADNAPDGSDLPVAERAPERLGRGEFLGAGDQGAAITRGLPQRAPAAIVELPDGRLGVCGFLDGEMWAYEIIDRSPPDSDDQILFQVVRAGTIGPCQSGAAVLADGTIATVAVNDDGDLELLTRANS